MLRVAWATSGEELVEIPIDECGTAEVLKQRLQEECGLPVFLQRILHQGVILDDQARLDSILHVQLLLLPVHTTRRHGGRI